MTTVEFKYSDYCTAYYVPSSAAVYIFDEIKCRELQRILATDAYHAELIMSAWVNNAPQGIIAERL